MTTSFIYSSMTQFGHSFPSAAASASDTYHNVDTICPHQYPQQLPTNSDSAFQNQTLYVENQPRDNAHSLSAISEIEDKLRCSPTPSNLDAHDIQNQPLLCSSAPSESTASVQSATSSTMGSPSIHPQLAFNPNYIYPQEPDYSIATEFFYNHQTADGQFLDAQVHVLDGQLVDVQLVDAQVPKVSNYVDPMNTINEYNSFNNISNDINNDIKNNAANNNNDNNNSINNLESLDNINSLNNLDNLGGELNTLENFVPIDHLNTPPMPAYGNNLANVAHSNFFQGSPTAGVDAITMGNFVQRNDSFVPPYTAYQNESPSLMNSPLALESPVSTPLTRQSSTMSDNAKNDDFKLCPYPDCGRSYKDIKSHITTHLAERPEKCPIKSCDYHVKGFSRKYDKNRHTLTHYKGVLFCPFCPKIGILDGKNHARVDVFKKHLAAIHHAEQASPNGRRRSSFKRSNTKSDSALCALCGQTYDNPTHYYDHMDECVFRLIRKKDPAEDINHRHLTAINDNQEVKETLEKNNLPTTIDEITFSIEDGVEDDQNIEEDENFEIYDSFTNSDDAAEPNSAGTGRMIQSQRKSQGLGNGSKDSSSRVQKRTRRTGLTLSKKGVKLATAAGRRKKKDYPNDWATSPGKMTMKKRVMCVFDGQRRLAKDDMMLHSDYQVITEQLPATFGQSQYVTEFDRYSLMRADAIFNASEEERGPWVADSTLDSNMLDDNSTPPML